MLSFEGNEKKSVAIILNKTDLATDTMIHTTENFIRIDDILSERASSFYSKRKADDSTELTDVKMYGSALGHQLASDIRNWMSCIL